MAKIQTPPPLPAAAEKPKRTRAAAPETQTVTTREVAVYAGQSLPAEFASELEAHAGLGTENVGSGDLSIPFLSILQSNSPQVSKASSKYVDGAAAGDFYESGSGELWAGDTGIEVIPLSYETELVEWIPRSAGGGFVRRHDANARPLSTRDPRTGRDVLANGNELVESARFFALVKGERGYSPVVISFTSTQRKKARRWLNAIMSQRLQGSRGSYIAPMCAFSYTLTAAPEQNDRGAWFGFVIGKGVLLTDTGTFKTAIELVKTIRGGAVQIAEPETYDSPQAGFAPEESSDIPI
jgi:hypothetical protein